MKLIEKIILYTGMGLTALSLADFILFMLRATNESNVHHDAFGGYLYVFYPFLTLLAFEPLLLGICFSQVSQKRKHTYSVFAMGLFTVLFYVVWALYLLAFYSLYNTSSYCDVVCGIDFIFLLPVLIIFLPLTLVAVSHNRLSTEKNSLINFFLLTCACLFVLGTVMLAGLAISYFI